jgi:oligosaccharide repeat unit polymerase
MGMDVFFLIAFSIWEIMVLYCVNNLRKRIILLFFLISFFTFLLGGHLVYELFGLELKHYYGYEYYKFSNLTLIVSLFFLFLGYFFAENIKIRHYEHIDDNLSYISLCDTKYHRTVRKVALIMFFISYPFYMYSNADVVSFVLSNSYSSYYSTYTSSVPYFVGVVANMSANFFFLYLATMPSKKELKIPMLLYTSCGVLSLFSGRRFNFVFTILFLVLYFLIRHYASDEVWIEKKHVILLAVGFPVLCITMYLYNYIRFDQDVSDFNLASLFFGFFQQQGFSSSLMRMEMYYRSKLVNHPYSFSGLEKFIHTNVIFRNLLHLDSGFSYYNQNISRAINSNSLDQALSYYALGKSSYLSGSGVGSCYIAELYTDLGYVGVAIGNFAYGVLLKIVNRTWLKTTHVNVWTVAFAFALVESILKTPRWNYDVVITFALDTAMWSAFLIVWFVAKFIMSTRGNK